MNKILFLDLEDTVIESFTTDDLIRRDVNHPRVSAFIEREQPDAFRLFSFAISDDSDIWTYKHWWHQWLCTRLRIDPARFDLSNVFTPEKLLQLSHQVGHVFENAYECRLFHGKQYGFQRYIELSKEFDDHEVVLLDDAVKTHLLTYPSRNLHLRMVNVAEI